jgi:hypothetical protein
MKNSSAVAKKEEPLEFGAAVVEGVAWCIAAKQPPSKIITDAILEGLSPAAFREMARRGWIYEVNNALHSGRSPETRPADRSTARPGGHPADGRNPRGAWKPLDDIAVVGADGALKRLASFELADLAFLRDQALAQETGWAKRRAWAERGSELLKASKKSRIEELSKFQVEELSRLAGEAWS